MRVCEFFERKIEKYKEGKKVNELVVKIINENRKKHFLATDFLEAKITLPALINTMTAPIDHQSQIDSYTSLPKFQKYVSQKAITRNMSLDLRKPSISIAKLKRQSIILEKIEVGQAKSPFIKRGLYENFMPDFNQKREKS